MSHSDIQCHLTLSVTMLSKRVIETTLNPPKDAFEATKVGLRQQKKSQTREALIQAASAAFEEHGYATVTMDDVAARAGVSRRTCFRYFPTKEALVFPRDDERLIRFQQRLAPELGESPYSAVRRACLEVADDHVTRREEVLAQAALIRATPALQLHERRVDLAWQRAIEDALSADKRGKRARRLQRVRAAAIVGAIRAVLDEWAEDGGRRNLRAIGEEAFAMLEEGIASPKH